MATPSKKSPSMEAVIEQVSQMLYGRPWRESIENGVCVSCGKSATEFKDERSKTEFTLSGFCQLCQDEVFDDG